VSANGMWWMLWTVRASMVLYVVALLLLIMRWGRGMARVLWVAGCVLLWVHVGLAFGLVHGWSHSRAVLETARQTYEATGWRSGAGVYFNYLTMVIWALDAAYWCAVGHRRYLRRPLWITLLVYGFLSSMAYCATAIFAPRPTQIFTHLVLMVIFLIAWIGSNPPDRGPAVK
jgi:hypothetical protein